MKKKNEVSKEDIISKYIDQLNNEKKPEINLNDLDDGETTELEEMFATIRAVKRLQDNDINKYINESKERNRNLIPELKQNRWNIQRLVSITAIFILLFTGLIYQYFIVSNNNIIYAMMESYEELISYSGKIRFTLEHNDEIELKEEIEIKFKKPDKYYAIHEINGRRFKKISDGSTTYSIRDEKIVIQDSHSDMDSRYFYFNYQIENLKEKVKEFKKIGSDTIAGRKVIIYQFKYTNEDPHHKIWIDKETNLPLKRESNYKNGDKITSEFLTIEFNSDINSSIFEYTPEENELVEDMRKGNKQIIKENQPNMEVLNYNNCKVIYKERIDNNFGVFEIDKKIYVLGLGDSVKKAFSNVKSGTKLIVKLEDVSWSRNPVIVEIIEINKDNKN